MRADAKELIQAGWGCMVKGRTAHKTDSDCLSDKDWLIPLKDLAEAEEHGYTICKKCGSTSVPAPSGTTAT